MTEKEWLKSNKPEALLQFLARKRTKGLLRKLRLFCCAACRRIEPSLPVQAQEVVSTVEELSDHDDQSKKAWFPGQSERRAMVAGTYEAGEKARAASHALGTLEFMLLRDRPSHAAFTATLALREVVVASTGKRPTMTGYVGWTPRLTARWDNHGKAVRGAFAQLLRHVIGNPFRPHPASPSSWPSPVVKLAEAMYAGEDCSFALHDALLEAGHPELAEHFAKEHWHPKGCWVVDMILGRQ